ncbi:TPA: hypothetical protein ACH3X2_000057 [Trebouxia sp. C0005]|nr:MAG: SDA1 protein isoform 1 [Trebouxia sp. A1-2]
MAKSGAGLLALQGCIKRDPEGHADDFALQWRHYKACLDIFNLKPSKDSKEFADLVTFIAQVCTCYPEQTAGFAQEVIDLLDRHYAVLNSALRQSLVKSLILLRNRGHLKSAEVLPLFFRLFRCQDKGLRDLLFKHIVADIKTANQKHRNEQLNRTIQNFLYSLLATDNDVAAKKSLAVLTELWRRHVWRDARTVNVIASAVFNSNSRIMVAALKFFLGQDEAADNESDDDDDDDFKAVQPSKAEVYKANSKGTKSSKKKKQAKLKRVMATVKKQAKKENANPHDSFAAVQLLNDPQSFAEKLFTQLNVRYKKETWETRLAMITVTARVIGVHKLLMDEKYYASYLNLVQPRQRDVTHVLAALIMACHDLVPPDWLQPVMRHLCNQFVHDRARPEEITVGLKTVREICMRMPLIMSEEVLLDLTAYKKYKEKAVASAARSLITLFREIAPYMLEKKDRGRGADLEARPMEYGAGTVRDRVEGAELLEAAELRGDDSDAESDSDGSAAESDVELDSSEADVDQEGVPEAVELSDVDSELNESKAQPDCSDSDAEAESGESDEAEEGQDEEEEQLASDAAAGIASTSYGESAEQAAEDAGPSSSRSQTARSMSPSQSCSDGNNASDSLASSSPLSDLEGAEQEEVDSQHEEQEDEQNEGPHGKSRQKHHKAKLQPAADSLQTLKRKLAAVKGAQAQADGDHGEAGVPIEWGRVLSAEDFERIKELRHKQAVNNTMQKFGLKTTKSKRARRGTEAEEEAEAALQFKDGLSVVSEARVAAEDLQGRHKRRKNKEERMKSVLEGREDRLGFGAASGLRKKKTGGTSNREKAKNKNMPAAARVRQISRRTKSNRGKGKGFRGHVKGGNFDRSRK